jgi:hypothetical protein
MGLATGKLASLRTSLIYLQGCALTAQGRMPWFRKLKKAGLATSGA